jgi:tetratricopeptide (TPR) repeat protein
MLSGFKKESFFEQAKTSRIKGDYKEYISILEDGHENGDQNCTYLLARCYYHGYYNVEKDVKLGLKMLNNNSNHIKSLVMLCRDYYYYRDGLTETIQRILFEVSGDNFGRGFCYLYDFGITGDKHMLLERALSEFSIILNEEDDEICYHLGVLYLEIGDRIESNKWFFKAAEQGNYEAIEKVIEIYLYGKGVKRNLEVTYEWLKKLFKIQGKNCRLSSYINLDVDRLTTEEQLDLKISNDIIDYYLDQDNYYLAWWIWRTSKNTLKLNTIQCNYFKAFSNCYKITLTLLCLSKCSRVFPKDIWIMLSKYVWKTRHSILK